MGEARCWIWKRSRRHSGDRLGGGTSTESKPIHSRTASHTPPPYTHCAPHTPHLTQHTAHTPYVHPTVSPTHCIRLCAHTHTQVPSHLYHTLPVTPSLTHPRSCTPVHLSTPFTLSCPYTHTPSHSHLSLTHSWAASVTQRPWRVRGGGP